MHIVFSVCHIIIISYTINLFQPTKIIFLWLDVKYAFTDNYVTINGEKIKMQKLFDTLKSK